MIGIIVITVIPLSLPDYRRAAVARTITIAVVGPVSIVALLPVPVPVPVVIRLPVLLRLTIVVGPVAVGL